MTRNLYLYGMIEEKSVLPIIEKLNRFSKEDEMKLKLEKNPNIEPVRLHICSYGGAVHPAFALIDTMKNIITPVITIAEGAVYSCGSLIALSGDYRIIQPNSRHMIHSISSGVIDKFQSMKEHVEQLSDVNIRVNSLIASSTKIPLETLNNVVESRTDWYISPMECLALGLADAIEKPQKLEFDFNK